MIVALLNQKGGVGKTTLALHLAGRWAVKGRRVVVIDADPQGSALDWSEARAQARGQRLFGVIGLGGALILALETRDTKPPEQELYHTGNKPAADGLAGLPRDYSAIPKLGPPLPGDFARPMLDAQNRAVPGSVGVRREVRSPASRASTRWLATQMSTSASQIVAMPCSGTASTRIVTPPMRKSIGVVRRDLMRLKKG